MLWALGYVAGGAVGQWVHLLAALALLHFVLALLKAGRHLPRSHGRWPEAPPGTARRPGLSPIEGRVGVPPGSGG